MSWFSWSIVVAAIVGVFGVGGLWYSPALFGNIWNRESGTNPKSEKGNHAPVVFGVSFIMGLISAAATYWLLQHFGAMRPLSFLDTVCLTASIGASLVATSFAINYLFGGRSMKLLAIDAGYHIVQFTSYGVVFALWNLLTTIR